VPIKDKVSVK